MKRLTLLICVFAISRSVYATGGDWFEYPAKLSDTLDMLPGKSLGEIFLETSNIPTQTTPVDLDGAGRDMANRLGKEPVPALLKRCDELIAQARAQNDTAALQSRA